MVFTAWEPQSCSITLSTHFAVIGSNDGAIPIVGSDDFSILLKPIYLLKNQTNLTHFWLTCQTKALNSFISALLIFFLLLCKQKFQTDWFFCFWVRHSTLLRTSSWFYSATGFNTWFICLWVQLFVLVWLRLRT